MAAVNLYPPIVDSYMPAFLNPSTKNRYYKCRIYFSLSPLNAETEIGFVQVSVINQATNKSALSNSYPTEIKIVRLPEPDSATGLHYVDLYVGKDKNGNPYDMERFEINQYYKVQFRFTTIDTTELSTNNLKEFILDAEKGEKYTSYAPPSSWLSANLNRFSEWSTVCLIKGISNPTFTFTSSVMNSLSATGRKEVDLPENLPIIGSFGFEDANETEYLKSYRITLKDVNSVTLEDSGLLFTDSFNPNAINYVGKYLTETGKTYTLRIDYTTSNLYEGAFSYIFTRIDKEGLQLNATLEAYLDRDNDQIMLKISNLQEATSGDLIIKRTSSDSNFNIWENIHKVSLSKLRELSASGYLWGDMTVQSGKWYKYAIQSVINSGTANVAYSEHIRMENPVSLMIEEICLVGANSQLKVKFDPKISSFNHKVVQSITETIGSKYPFIRRNGNIGYKTFNISGLITRHMDEYELFATRADVYGGEDLIPYYEEYNKEYHINPYNDHTYEYLFREKVIEFLNDGKVKLFRSPSEGNILISLSNVSLTPNETLGRMIYSFSATATEVAATNIDNYMNYNIIDYEANKYLLQGITIEKTNDDNILAYVTDKEIKEGDFVINAGAFVGDEVTLILSTF